MPPVAQVAPAARFVADGSAQNALEKMEQAADDAGKLASGAMAGTPTLPPP